MLRQSDNKRLKHNENEAEESSLGIKGNNKPLGLASGQNLNKSFIRNNDSGLKSKSTNQPFNVFQNKDDKQKLQKQPSSIPLKRSELAVGLTHYSESKKQHIQGVEKTYRHREQEIEWTPEGLDLDFSPFGNTVDETNYDMKESMFEDDNEEQFPIAQRRFALEEQVEEESSTLEELVISSQEGEIDNDTSRVEYGPPKEIELPYVPHESCVVDVSDFSGYADLSAYELVRLFYADELEFCLDDTDALDQLSIQLIDDDALKFDYELSDNEVEMSEEKDFDIPFNNHTFDIEHFIQCN